MKHLGWSSCLYPLEAADLVSVPDYVGSAISRTELPEGEVLLLLAKDRPDRLLAGRAVVQAVAEKGGTVDVRLVFEPTIGKWNVPFAMIRALRDRRRFKSSNIYHIAPSAIRSLRLERAVRTLDNPQTRGGVDRRAKMSKLEESLRAHGYDDARPIDVWLCRSRGDDSLRQGHHRVSACLACGIGRMSIRFSAAAALPQAFWRFIGSVPVRMDVLKGSLESSIGDTVSRIVPLGDRPVPRKVIVVPAKGGRFVLNLVPDRRMPVGIARALIIPVMVFGALALDIAVLKTACGERSLVAWSQFALAGLASCALLPAAVHEPRGRAGYLAVSSVFAMMAVYELIRDVFDIGHHGVGLGIVGAAVAVVVACAAISWRTFKTGVSRVACSGGSPALPFGFLFVWGISKLVSSRIIWGSLQLTEHDVRMVKHIVEESTELFGYAIIASWAASFFLERLAYRGRR